MKSINKIWKIYLLIFFIIIIFAAVFYFFYLMNSDNFFQYERPQLSARVGARLFSFIDTNRKDAHDPRFQRELPVAVWYPAQNDEANKTSKWGYQNRQIIIETIAKKFNLPNWLIEGIFQYESRSSLSALPRDGKYPVTFIFHGLGGGPKENYTDLAEYIASHGFIVIGIDFPFGAIATKISQQNEPIFIARDLQEILSRYPKSKSDLIRLKLKEYFLWVQDIHFVLSELKKTDLEITSHMDFEKISFIGHSHGGMAALQACLEIEACYASVNMDGWTYEIEFTKNLKNHLLIYTLSSGDYMRTFCTDKQNCHEYEIDKCDIGHDGFSDYVYFKWPISRFVKNHCGGNSVKEKNKINQKILDFISN